MIVTSFSSWDEGKEQACVVGPGDHPFFVDRTVVMYCLMTPTLESYIEDGFTAGTFTRKPPISVPLFNKVVAGLSRVDSVSEEVLEILRQHKVLT